MSSLAKSRPLFVNRVLQVITIVVSSFILGLTSTVAAQDIIYVNQSATGTNTGASWSDAYTDLQSALSTATGSDEIWIAEGTYKPTDGTDRTISLTITGAQDGLKIYGGFIGTETIRESRNPGENPTIISGDLNNDGDLGGNSYHLFYLDGISGGNITSSTVIDGLVLTGGNAVGTDEDENGAALFCDGSGSGNACNPTFRRLVFSGNYADYRGGALYNKGRAGGEASPTIVNSIFVNNSSGYAGGAITNYAYEGTSSPVITNVTITGNSADRGGAMSNSTGYSTDDSSPVITNSILYGNQADSYGDVLYNYQDGAQPTIQHSLVTGGSSAIYEYSGSNTNYDNSTNTEADPKFGRPDSPRGLDGYFHTEDDGLRLASNSPAIDAGDNSAISQNIDLTNSNRVQNGTVDMGAYEGAADFSPKIDSFYPTIAEPGEEISIEGIYLSKANQVTIDGVSASYTVHSETEMTVTFPQNATNGPIEIITPEKTVTSDGNIQQEENPYSSETALAFDGDGDYLEADDNIRLDERSFSISFWAKRDASDSDDYIISQGGTKSDNQSLHIGFRESDEFTFAFYSDDLDISSSYTDTQWHHWAVTYDASTGDRKVYRDGMVVASDQASSDFQGTGALLIGTAPFGERADDFIGQLDEVRIWEKVRTQSEIKGSMHQNITGNESGLVSYYRFDTGTGQTTYDHTGPSSAHFNGDPVWQEADIPFGQQSSLAQSTGETSIGSSGAQFMTEITSSAGADNFLSLYSYGSTGDSTIDNETFPEGITKRANTMWGIQETGSVTFDLIIDFSDVQGIQHPRLLKRTTPDSDWQDVTDQSAFNQTDKIFSTNGLTEPGEYAIGETTEIFVSGFSPSESLINRDITITGGNLDDITAVTIGEAEADFTNDSDTKITATVPEDAATGAVEVSNSEQTLTADGTFTVLGPIFVDTDATGNNDGSSWANAFTDLQDAINVAEGDDAIWIAEGTYKPGTSRDDSFLLNGAQDGLKIYGGFSGDEQSLQERNPSEHPVIASGDIDDDGTLDYNSNNIFYLNAEDGGYFTRNTRIDGLTIKDGNYSINGDPLGYGSGLYCSGTYHGEDVGTCGVTLANVIFEGNKSRSGAINVENIKGEHGPKIINSLFLNNIGEYGGAIRSYEGKLTVINSSFIGNSSDRDGGGAIYNTEFDGGSVEVINSLFYNNTGKDFSSTREISGSIKFSIFENGKNDVANDGDVTYESSNIAGDPLLVDVSNPLGEDGRIGTADDGLRLRRSSPALNAGDNDAVAEEITTDITGAERIQQSTVDIGVYEGGVSTTDLALTIEADTTIISDGEIFTFTIEVTNIGNSDATGIEIDAALPEDLSHQNDMGNGTYSTTSGIWSIGSLVQDETKSVTISALSQTNLLQEYEVQLSSVDQSELEKSNNKSSVVIYTIPYGSGQGLALDGQDDYVSLPEGTMSATKGTIEHWVLYEGDDGMLMYSSDGTGGSYDGYTGVSGIEFHTAINPDGEFNFTYDGGAASGQLSSNTTLQSGQWYHLAVSYDLLDTKEMKLYIDGELDKEATFSGTPGGNEPTLVRLGRPGDGNRYFKGTVDEVRTWDDVRAQSEIREKMHQTIIGSEDELIANYRFDNMDNATVYDYAGSNKGTLNGEPGKDNTNLAIGQNSITASTSSSTIGLSGSQLTVTPDLADDQNHLTLYYYGSQDGESVKSGDLPGQIAERANIIWGIEEVGDISSDVTFSYSDISNVRLENPRLLKRTNPTDDWQDVTGQFTHDAEAKTFSASGVSEFSQYTIAENRAPGLARQSLSFDGTDDYVATGADGDDLGLANESFTIEGWYKVNDLEDNSTILGMDASGDNKALHLIIKPEGEIRFGFYSNDLDTPENTAETDTWQHVTFVYDKSSSTRKIYVNGKEVASDQTSTDFQGTSKVLIARWTDSDYFSGLIDEVRIWQDARSAAEIRTNMFQELNGDESDLIAYWPMDMGTGEIAKDRTSEYDGTIQGAEWDFDTYPYGTVITGGEGWRMLSAPTGDKTYAEILDELWTQGIPGSDSPNAGAPNVLKWDEPSQTFAPVDATKTPSAGEGFIAYVYDDENYDGTDEGFPKMLQAGGTQRSGNVNPTVSYTDDGDEEDSDDGWNLIANPYGATIDWDAANGWTKEGLTGNIHVWSDSADSYLSWNGSAGTLPNGKIAPWQSFWVKANGNATPELEFTDEVRDAGAALYKQQERTEPVSQLKLTLKAPDERRSSTVLHFDNKASLDKDKLDTWKLDPLSSDYLSLYTTNKKGQSFDIQSLPIDTEALKDKIMEVPLYVEDSNSGGTYSFYWDAPELPDGWSITLKDTYSDKIVTLSEAGSYEFEMSGNSDTSEKQKQQGQSKAKGKQLAVPVQQSMAKTAGKEGQVKNQRFVLMINPHGAEQELADIPDQAQLNDNYPNPFNPTTVIRYGVPKQTNVQLTVFNVLGQKVRTLVDSQKTAGQYEVNFDGSRLASGMYIYRLKIGAEILTKKMMLIK